jgi:Arm domain-containing DNA-binding protein
VTRTGGHPMRLTDRAVKSLPLPAKGNKLFYDDEVKGFACRVTAAGTRSFVLNYHIDGRERRITIGGFSQWSVIAAREEAMRLKVEADRGHDPTVPREAATIAELVESYQAHELPRLRPESQRQYRAIITELILPRLSGLKVSAVSFSRGDRAADPGSGRAPESAERERGAPAGAYRRPQERSARHALGGPGPAGRRMDQA